MRVVLPKESSNMVQPLRFRHTQQLRSRRRCCYC
jgi:hypothetical protein